MAITLFPNESLPREFILDSSFLKIVLAVALSIYIEATMRTAHGARTGRASANREGPAAAL
jgi:hypothetical protein